MRERQLLKTDVLIIGGGITGAGIARDLALRGVRSIVVERTDLNAGASGANHGLLHSGARYILTDPESSRECSEENKILKRLAPHCIENSGGIYLAVAGDDENYIADFQGRCAECGVPVRELDLAEARALEPAIADNIIAAYATKDAAIDPFMLVTDNIAQAQRLGATLLRHTAVVGFQKQRGRIATVELKDQLTGKPLAIEAEQIVNAAGAWVGEVAAMAGADIDIVYSKGTLLVTSDRIARHVLLRLRPPSDADALVPGGAVSLLGPTSIRLHSLDDIRPTADEVDTIIDGGASMCPTLRHARYIRAFSGVRPLIAQATKDDRAISRGFDFRDHASDGLDNFITAAGGKLSTYRIMAEKLSGIICKRLGVDQPCQTRTTPLPSTRKNRWTEPGAAPRAWIKEQPNDDMFLCECEMVPASIIGEIIDALDDQGVSAGMQTIALRSRVGKGPCQGTTCGARLTSYLHERGDLKGGQHFDGLAQFLEGRWKGERPILWNTQLAQTELKESLYCGFLSMHNELNR